ncbi:MAG: hypothetical protein ACRD3Q_16605 [Terriglobales bacterium]
MGARRAVPTRRGDRPRRRGRSGAARDDYTQLRLDGSKWESLSKAYFVHFQTWAKAAVRYPSYYLYQHC